VKVAMPRFGENIAPCFGYSATIAIFTISRQRVIDQTDFTLQSREALDRVRLLADQGVDVLICGGVQAAVERLIQAREIRVYSWVAGRVEDLLNQFLENRLSSGAAQQNSASDGSSASGDGGEPEP
jgi:predicted Fe-Mo cluster-binding NifX family protein